MLQPDPLFIVSVSYQFKKSKYQYRISIIKSKYQYCISRFELVLEIFKFVTHSKFSNSNYITSMVSNSIIFVKLSIQSFQIVKLFISKVSNSKIIHFESLK